MRHTSVFEFDYLTSDQEAATELQATCISCDAFNYLKEVSLSTYETETRKCLSLCKRYGYELIQVKNYVGVLFTPTGEHIEVLPKIGRKKSDPALAKKVAQDTLLMMLQHLGIFRHLVTNQASVVTKKMPLLEVFISQFLASVNLLVKRGLKSDYVRTVDNQNFLKGKLLVAEQLRHNLVNQHKFYVEFDEYQINRPANRLIKTAMVTLEKYTRLATNQKLLRELAFAFADVPLSKSIKQDINDLKLDRSMKDYYAPIDWAKIILEGFSPLSMQGDHNALSLLFPMESVFESYVASILREQLAEEVTLTTQARSKYLVIHNEQNQFLLKPDLLVRLPNNKKMVMDSKWKLLDESLSNGGLSQSDFYQMFAYGHKYLDGKGDMVLIYPSCETFQNPIKTSFNFNENLRLWIVPMDLAPDIENYERFKLPENLIQTTALLQITANS
ncbi:McrC family protein [Marinomonas flavescens]|uniref:McrC family protein n=1 Tax=Marinomonas flavescens TaxID=2529379 RepID=UPI001056920C|nr:McrC family protein [Marinomonas flavescens]